LYRLTENRLSFRKGRRFYYVDFPEGVTRRMEIKGKVNTAGCCAKVIEEEAMEEEAMEERAIEEEAMEEEAMEEKAMEQEAMEQIRGICTGRRKSDLKPFFDRFVKKFL
jgi:predicted Holliday junction resolvase-like endonuclease